MSAQLGLFGDEPAPVPERIVEVSRPAASIAPRVAAEPPCRVQDGIARLVVGRSRNMLVPWFLIAAWAYYVGDVPLLSDAMFDEICRALDAEWNDVEHRHKHLVDRSWLAAGTCLLARNLYPASVRGASAHLARCAGLPAVPRA